MKALLLLVCFIAASFAQVHKPVFAFKPIGDVPLDREFRSWMPQWSGGALVAIDNNRTALPSVLVFDEKGQLQREIPVRIPVADWVHVGSAAHGVNGTVAVCGFAKDSKAHVAGYIALADAEGKLRKLVRTEPYVPTAVTVAPDGTVWTKGAEYDLARKPIRTDNGIIRHFDSSGNLIAKFLPQSNLTIRELSFGIDYVACNAGRVGWYMGRGASHYFEVVGEAVETYPVVKTESADSLEYVSGLTITEQNQVFATKDFHGSSHELYVLDRELKNWRRIEGPTGGTPATTNWLLGGSGDTLVFATTAGLGCLRRFHMTTEKR